MEQLLRLAVHAVGQLMQLLGVIIVAVYSFVVTIIIFKVISAWGPIRVTKEEEEAGLDESLHGEEAYKM